MPCAAAEPVAFRFSKELDRSASQKESIFAVTLDSDVYAATQPGFSDVRIFDARGKEVPCVMEKAAEPRMHAVRGTCASRVVSLKEHEDAIELIVQLHEKSPDADGLTIVTPLKDYERRVRVFGSQDGVNWKPLTSEGLVFDYSRYMDIGNREVRLPKNDCRWFKINLVGIADAKESPFLKLTRKYRGDNETERVETTAMERRPFRMDRIEFWLEKNEKLSECEKRVAYPVVSCRAEENADEKMTVVEVTSRREPLTALTLETSSRNFSRAAVVQVPVKRGVRTEWIDIGRGTVSLVDFGGYRKETLSIHFPEHRETSYRIVIHDEDSPPLAISGVTALGNVYRAIFLAAENEAYRLGYGSDDAKQPNYDAAAVLAPLRQGQAVSDARLGKETANAAAVAPSALTLRALLNNGPLLGVIAIALVALLTLALFRAARRINELPKE